MCSKIKGALMAEDENTKKGGIFRALLQFVLALIAIFAVAFLLRTFVFQSYEIPSGSMEDTIQPGDLVFAEKISYYTGEPEQGDIVTFDDPEIASRTLIKRVVATGGQTVDLKDGFVYVDGKKLDETYTEGKPSYPLDSAKDANVVYPYRVPVGHIWVMGDNRTSSQDSRYFGSVPISSVQGRAVFRYWPLSSIGLLE